MNQNENQNGLGGEARDLLQPLMDRLGYNFTDLDLLTRSLTHRSYTNEQTGKVGHNERLEFLGDAVLGVCVADLLIKKMPQSREGELTKTRASLVSEIGLAKIAATLDLGSFLRLGKGEELNGGREKTSILSDAVEAMIAALYLDGGFQTVKYLLEKLFEPYIDAAIRGDFDSDYKTRLQEFMGAQGDVLEYRVVDTNGPDHAKVFEVAVFKDSEDIAHGLGRSKKEAEQRAAQRALEKIK